MFARSSFSLMQAGLEAVRRCLILALLGVEEQFTQQSTGFFARCEYIATRMNVLNMRRREVENLSTLR